MRIRNMRDFAAGGHGAAGDLWRACALLGHRKRQREVALVSKIVCDLCVCVLCVVCVLCAV